MRVLISGMTGFVGGHLVERLLAEGTHAVCGFTRETRWPANLLHLKPQVELHVADLLDPAAMRRVLTETRPEWIFHLAGHASPGKSFKEPGPCWAANLTGTQVLFDAVAESGLKPRILFASTGLVYGDPLPGQGAFDELSPLRPASPYATSKAAADLLAYQVTRHPGLDVVRVRLFNQIGPRQSADYAVANFARQIAAIERGEQSPILRTGDLSAQRDITDVRDLVRALIQLMHRAPRGEVYNIGRGQTWRMADLLAALVQRANVTVEVRQESEVHRLADTTVSRANPQKLIDLTGWTPQFTIEQTLQDILDDWRSRPTE
jgi:GDP-4-dehydro-6-deoxy-D-mannose reductase